MAHPVIDIENIGKAYRLGQASVRRDMLRDALLDVLQAPFRRLKALRHLAEDDDLFWALRNVSFQVLQGEVVGIIGRNGAGKSTLLKILSRVTAPTEGQAVLCGRVASLLEVGTGFHPELTGRENIYLNGSILGMRKAEIDAKFDEIVEFSELERFLGTPVKRYSSGMYVRLAFAVAAHLEPEILILDEVLAVGDTEFQKKCLGKIGEVTTEGRTVLFVSHNLDSVQRLCSRSVLLEAGRLISQGPTADVIRHYLSRLSITSQAAVPNEWIDVSHASRSGTGEARFAAVKFSSLREDVAFHPCSNGPLEFSLAIDSDSPRSVGSVAVSIYSRSGTKLINADTLSLGRAVKLSHNRTVVTLRIEKLYLNPDTYVVGLWLANPVEADYADQCFDYVEAAFSIEVVSPGSRGLGVRPSSDGAVMSPFQIIDKS
jgi:ABC-type polysaccharide/polyol phosphate transport system ATPase subunit